MVKNYVRLIVALVFATNLMAQNVPNYVPTNGLVGWWPFNGNANDESGNENHGTVNGATLTADRNGKVNSAYSFDGVSNNIVVNDANSLDLSYTATISGWFNISNLNIDQVNNIYTARLVDKITAGSADGYMIDCGSNVDDSKTYYCENGNTRLRGIMGGCDQELTSCFQFSSNWIHFTVTFNNGLEKIYIDGNLVHEINCSNNQIPTNNLDLIFGHYLIKCVS
jgi:hypothetical protein